MQSLRRGYHNKSDVMAVILRRVDDVCGDNGISLGMCSAIDEDATAKLIQCMGMLVQCMAR